MVVDLARWLGVQLDEDDRIARAVQQPDDYPWEARHMAGEVAEGTIRWDVPGVAQPTHEDPLNKARMEHIAAHDPARVLREIDAKRQILALLPELEQADRLIEGEWGSSDNLADKLLDALLASYPKCGATTVFWPDDEACDAECMWPRGHGGTKHMDETLGSWGEEDLYTSYPHE